LLGAAALEYNPRQGGFLDCRSGFVAPERIPAAVPKSFRNCEKTLKNFYRRLMAAQQSPAYVFGPFRLDPRERRLHLDGEQLSLSDKSFETLLMLVENAGHLVEKDDLMRRLWPNTFVEEANLAKHVSLLRKVLSEATNGQEFIETVPKRGYRFVAPVKNAVETRNTSETAPHSQANLTGKKVAHYRVLELLGGGGMGLVYMAEDIKLGRRVALKFLPEELASDAVALERFEREARAASSLNHPSICTIHAIEEQAGQPFLSMELLEGETLRESISSGRFPGLKNDGNSQQQFGRLVDIALQIADGLDAAHRKGIIHRDIKPANIFLTTQGRAKILDFGLAKLQGSELPEAPVSAGPKTSTEWSPNLTLTRTGTAIGTAGYMSPEQIRGEKLDSRTDLFSFGMVLYEMATGQRAFTGDTAPVLRDSILGCAPTPVRKLNPNIPLSLEHIIYKSLEKDRESRYQDAAQLRSDLTLVMREISKATPFRRRLSVAAALAALLLAGTALRFWRHQTAFSEPRTEVKLVQLTANSPENQVTGGAISPDGKYLAYTDDKGMHLKLIGADEAQVIPQPEELKNVNVNWEIMNTAWFPDSQRFLANAHPGDQNGSQWSSVGTSVWVISVHGDPPRKLRDEALSWSVSPDGSAIAIAANKGPLGTRELWLIAPDGLPLRSLDKVGENASTGGSVYFFRDGERVTYTINDGSGDALIVRDLKGSAVTTLFPHSELRHITDWSWLPDGQLLFSDHCGDDLSRLDAPCNFWIERFDLRTGKATEKPRRLTNWVGFTMVSPAATADGKRVSFLRLSNRNASYVAELASSGTQLVNSKRFTFEEADKDAISDWTTDGKTLILIRNRSNRFSVYRQPLNSDIPQAIITSEPGSLEDAFVSPDGKWVILQVWPVNGDTTSRTTVKLMRVPITGGRAESILSMRNGGSSFCARAPANLCATAEESSDTTRMIVTSFDPVKGRGVELNSFEINSDQDSAEYVEHSMLCDISPDGSRLAVAKSSDGPIEIHSLRGQHTLVVRGNTLDKMRMLKWAADGKSLFVSRRLYDRSELVHVDLQGRTHTLWKSTGEYCFGKPSPDGLHMAIYDSQRTANMWMMENF